MKNNIRFSKRLFVWMVGAMILDVGILMLVASRVDSGIALNGNIMIGLGIVIMAVLMVTIIVAGTGHERPVCI